MSIDFANESFFTKISSSCISADNRAVTNLISREKKERSSGFQGERFVRTPITVQFQFYVPVEVNRIEFLPFIGRQCAKAIQLHVSKSYPLAKRDDSSVESIEKGVEYQFRRAGSVVLSKATRVSFVNRVYKPHPRLPATVSNPGSLESYTNGDMGSLTSLRIVIVNMLEGSVPSLTKLHIWGRPGRSCRLDLVKEIFDIYHASKSDIMELSNSSLELYGSASVSYDSQSGGNAGKVTETLASDQNEENETNCPTEFIDALTFEMMRMPVLLPSGYTIDRLTLDKHVKSQTEMGNIPSDPFTGIPFTSSAKPEPNVKLKVRMDAYLYHSSKTDNGSKTICTSKMEPTNSYVSRKRQRETENISEQKKLHPSELVKRHDCYDPVSSLGRGRADKKYESTTGNSLPNGHSDELSSSLNLALADIFHTQSKRKLGISRGQISTLHCAKCEALMPSSLAQYRLPCGHVVCSWCTKSIVNDSKIVCPTCLGGFESRNVHRVYD